MLIEEYSRIAMKIFSDWRDRDVKQRRKTLPPSFTSPVLRLIRSNACRREAPKSVECDKWSQRNPRLEDPGYADWEADTKGPYCKTGEFVCTGCNAGYVTSESFIEALCLNEKKVKFSDRTLRRYLNDKDPMTVDQFRRVVINGYLRGWLGGSVWTAYSIWQKIDKFEITRKSLDAVNKRALERKLFLEHGMVNVSQEEFEKELAKQRSLLDYEERCSIDRRVKAENLPPKVQQFMQVSLRTRSQEAANRIQVNDD